MRSARPATFARNVVGRRGPPINRTLMWFGPEAEQRRRSATAAQEALCRRAVTEFGWVGPHEIPYAEVRRKAQALRAAYLAALFRRVLAWLTALPRRAGTFKGNGFFAFSTQRWVTRGRQSISGPGQCDGEPVPRTRSTHTLRGEPGCEPRLLKRH
jgi:hypothetical protein